MLYKLQNTQKAIQLLQHNKVEDLRQIPRALLFCHKTGLWEPERLAY